MWLIRIVNDKQNKIGSEEVEVAQRREAAKNNECCLDQGLVFSGSASEG